MDKDTRNAIERAIQRARKLLEDDFSSQLEGTFDILRAGVVAGAGGAHLSARQVFQREKIVAAIEHKRAAGMTAAGAVADYIRDAAFTTVNRFVALKMLEARELVQECITKGEQSGGFKELCGLAPGLALLPDSAGYRLYIESLFDELSTEVKVLFDRRDSASVLWPKRQTFETLLAVLNAPELARVWGEDETIGWVYQFFNSGEERRAMREASQAPRNGRELAVRNQFFTPRYVVQFLTDNTLGRIWYEMCAGRTRLGTACGYLIRPPNGTSNTRAKKDPRDLRILDPACGSGHFLLYAMELLLVIYEEAWADDKAPRSEATGRTLRGDFPTIEALRRELPGLLLRYNLHGVDIDPRCAQIAQLALWMRAQRAFRDFEIPRTDRPQIRRANIAIAERMPGDLDLKAELLDRLQDRPLSEHFDELVGAMRLADELGILIRVENLVHGSSPKGATGKLFAPSADRMRTTLVRFVDEAAAAQQARRRLFADDASQGLALMELTERRFDVILMNPPFGDAALASRDAMAAAFPRSKHEICAAFVDRGLELLHSDGLLGAITTRLVLFNQSLSDWRKYLLSDAHLEVIADLGHGVLDAMVETALYVVGTATSADNGPRPDTAFLGLLGVGDKDYGLRNAVSNRDVSWRSAAVFREVPGAPLSYWVPESLLRRFSSMGSFLRRGGSVGPGIITGDDFRFFRLRWEVPRTEIVTSIRSLEDPQPQAAWIPVPKGGEYQLWHDPIELVVKWHLGGREVRNFTDEKGKLRSRPQNLQLFFRPGATYPYRTTSALGMRLLPNGCAFSNGGWGVFPPPGWTPEQVVCVYNSRAARYFVEVLLGSGDSASSGTAARNYGTEAVGGIPWPEKVGDVDRAVRSLEDDWKTVEWSDLEREDKLTEIARSSSSFDEACAAAWRERLTLWRRILEAHSRLEAAVEEAYRLTDAEKHAIADAEGPALASLGGGSCPVDTLTKLHVCGGTCRSWAQPNRW